MSSLSNDYLEKEMIFKFTNEYLENLDDDTKIQEISEVHAWPKVRVLMVLPLDDPAYNHQ
ncbi:hypothetical protein MTR_5g010015 [Medicago truncatula]|uniref:Uncharacterized protein n=1 Tax=Medicago truncatula TaxID=3880 RepID=A0A072UDC1_MEDTR|nr:hypothetical protein MTR_5g010015 [Medicago truncatula]